MLGTKKIFNFPYLLARVCTASPEQMKLQQLKKVTAQILLPAAVNALRSNKDHRIGFDISALKIEG